MFHKLVRKLILNLAGVGLFFKGQVIFLLCLFIIDFHPSLAQLNVTSAETEPYNPEYLIRNVFLGNGVEILDIKYEGKDFSVGYFDNAGNNINIDRGIIMTTGRSDFADKANDELNTTSHSSSIDYNDLDLLNAIDLDPGTPNLLQDIARYSITFIPYSDSLSFNYVFASEEYPEYACSQYEDVFGFFISGPDPDGGTYDAKNIALIPGTNEAVSISNVNNGDDNNPFCFPKHEEYYNDNTGSNDLTYNAFLDVFTAGAKVVPCQEYTIKIAIADVADALYDSAVFLEAESFSTNGILVDLETPNPDGKIAEACDQAVINFSFERARNDDFEIDFNLIQSHPSLNMAEKEVDYSGFPEKLIIPAGQTNLSISLYGIEDQIDEGPEWIILDFQKNACQRDTIRIAVIDRLLPAISVPESLILCRGDSSTIDLSLPPGFESPEPIRFRNHNNYAISPLNTSIYADIDVSGINASHLGPGIIDKVCIDTAWNSHLEDFDVFLFSPAGKFIELGTDIGKRTVGGSAIDSFINTCFSEISNISINPGDLETGIMDPTNPSYTGNFLPEGNWSDLWSGGNDPVNGTWSLMLIDDKNAFVGFLESWSISFHSNYKINFQWGPDNGEIECAYCEDPIVYPDSDELFHLQAIDSYGCSFFDSTLVNVKYIPPLPSLKCDSVSTDLIRFSWDQLADFNQYEYQINNTGNWTEISESEITFGDLDFDEEIVFSIRAFDDECQGESITVSCNTFPCPAPTVILEKIVHLNCFGMSDAEIDIDAHGTTTPYIYQYRNEINNNGHFENLDGGQDTIFITDGKNCTLPYLFEINEPDSIELSIETGQISCHNASDGQLAASPSGGNGDILFHWVNPAGQEFYQKSISDLAEGTYLAYAVDQNSCENFDSIHLYNPTPIELEAEIKDILCKSEANGSIDLVVSGGHGNYNYLWSGNDFSSTNSSIYNRTEGQYLLELTDAGNCTIDTIFNISEPDEYLDYIISKRDTLCPGAQNGYIELDITGGSQPYEISWNTGSIDLIQQNLGPGLYAFIITDDNKCKTLGRVEIQELPSLDIEVEQTLPSCFDSNDGRIEITGLSYGKIPGVSDLMTYSWSTEPPQHTSTAYYLKGGTQYGVQIIDKYGCTFVHKTFLDQPDSLNLSINYIRDASCFGSKDGQISVAGGGGNPPYSYKWNSNVINTKDSIAFDLGSGIYTLDLIDRNTCKKQFQVNIESPEALMIQSELMHITCFDGTDGKIEIQVFGGKAPYQTKWDNDQNSTIIEELKSGTYYCSILDMNGCELQDSFLIEQPASELFIFAESKDAICFGGQDGEIILQGEGGTGPYAFKINEAAWQGDNTFYGIKSGIYKAWISDANQCLDSIEQVYVDQGAELLVDLGRDTTLRYGERMQLDPYIQHDDPNLLEFIWDSSEPGILSCLDCRQPILNTTVPASLYLQVIDEKGCRGFDNLNVLVKTNRFINVPTAFSPNGDGHNEILQVFGSPESRVSVFHIFNQWGQLLYQDGNFKVNQPEKGWDGRYKGKLVTQGVYSWYIEAIHIDGSISIHKGQSTLL